MPLFNYKLSALLCWNLCKCIFKHPVDGNLLALAGLVRCSRQRATRAGQPNNRREALWRQFETDLVLRAKSHMYRRFIEAGDRNVLSLDNSALSNSLRQVHAAPTACNLPFSTSVISLAAFYTVWYSCLLCHNLTSSDSQYCITGMMMHGAFARTA